MKFVRSSQEVQKQFSECQQRKKDFPMRLKKEKKDNTKWYCRTSSYSDTVYIFVYMRVCMCVCVCVCICLNVYTCLYTCVDV